MRSCRPAPLLLCFAAGCLIPNPDFGGSGGSGSSGARTTSGPTSDATTQESTGPATSGASSTGGVSASGTGGSTDDLTSTSVDPSTTSATSSSSDATMSSSGALEPAMEHLQHYQGGCNTPQWCWENGDIYDPSAARVWSQACFAVQLAPPYQLTRVGYWIAGKAGDLGGDTRVQVHQRVGDAPGPLLGEQLLDPNTSLILGYNEVAFAPPLAISSDSGVCVGLVGGRRTFPGAALGVALDAAISAPDQSFSRVDGGMACDIPEWTDHVAFNPAKKTWCIDADVVKAP